MQRGWWDGVDRLNPLKSLKELGGYGAHSGSGFVTLASISANSRPLLESYGTHYGSGLVTLTSISANSCRSLFFDYIVPQVLWFVNTFFLFFFGGFFRYQKRCNLLLLRCHQTSKTDKGRQLPVQRVQPAR